MQTEDGGMTKKRKGSVSQETFDDFLTKQGMLEACEDHAIKEISDTRDTLRVELT
jgi:hypothetical protein